MQYRKMGNTGLKLSVLSFGSWVTFHKQIGDETSDKLMGMAYDVGINFFDNAEVYALGESEKQMGRILKAKNWDRSSFVVSSKVFFGHRGKDNKPNQTGLSRKHIIEACHEAIQRLQVDYLDLFYCHRPDPEVPIEEVVWTMHQLIMQGKILYWGTSEWSAAEIMEAHMYAKQNSLIGPVVEQPQYNLFERRKMELDFKPIFKNIGMGTTTWSPLASGLLTGKYNESIPENSRLSLEGFDWLKDKTLSVEKINKVKALGQIAKELDTNTATLSIAWCMKNPNVTTVILGATNSNQLQQNLEALDLYPKLDESILEKIELVMQTSPLPPSF